MSMATVTPQLLPTEIWDAVAGFIEHLSDLSSLARVSTRLHSIVAIHLQYRMICSRIDNLDFWKELALNHAKARSVWTLILRDAEAETCLTDATLCIDTGDYAIRKLAKRARWLISSSTGLGMDDPTWTLPVMNATNAMSQLNKLVLCVKLRQLIYLSTFFQMVNPDLQVLHVDLAGQNHLPTTDNLKLCLQTLHLLKVGYREFSLMFVAVHPHDAHDIIECLLRKLQGRCPGLEELRIVYGTTLENSGQLVTLSEHIQKSTWPLLRKLELSGIEFADPLGASFGPDFLLRHNNLEVLRLYNSCVLEEIPDTALPRLKELEIDDDCVDFRMSAFKPMADGTYRPIHSVGLAFSATGDDYMDRRDISSIADFCCDAGQAGLLQHLSVCLRGLDLSDGYCFGLLKLFGRCIPSIRTLTVQFIECSPIDFIAWARIASQFSSLEELRGKGDNGFLSPFDVGHAIALHQLSTLCPKLRRVDGSIIAPRINMNEGLT